MIETIDVLRVIAALILAAMALAAASNRHRGALQYIGRVIWSLSSAFILVVTFGKVRVPSLARRAKLRQANRWRRFLDRFRKDEPMEEGLDWESGKAGEDEPASELDNLVEEFSKIKKPPSDSKEVDDGEDPDKPPPIIL